MSDLVYFSSATNNTHRFVTKLGYDAERVHRIPLRPADEPLHVEREYVLVVPTYGGGNTGGAVPKQVIRFLNEERHRRLLRGVISAGNTNFGSDFCRAGDIISRKCTVPHLYRLELFGTPEDVARVSDGLERWWTQQ